MTIDNQNKSKPSIIFISLIAAFSSAVLIVLLFWGFENRSLVKLAIRSAILGSVIWYPLYFLVFRGLKSQISVQRLVIAMALVTAVIFSFHLIPFGNDRLRVGLTFVLTVSSFVLFYLSLLIIFLQSKRIPWPKIVFLTALAFGFTGLFIIFFNSLQARIYSDEFCYALKLEELGWLGSVRWFYTNWSGRLFSNFLVMGLSNKTLTITALLPLILIAFFLMNSFLRRDRHESFLPAVCVSVFLPFAVFMLAPDFYKSLYWASSAMVMLPILILMPVFITALIYLNSHSDKGDHWWLVAGALLSIMITTTHEVGALGWIFLNGAALVWAYVAGGEKGFLKKFLWASLAGSLSGLAVMLLSPGVASGGCATL